MSEGNDMAPKRLEIRKYPNRRYYDSTRSRHVTLEEIHQLIRDGYEVQITDSKTEQDITAKILGQIIIDLDSPKLGVFPVPLLHRLLRSNEQFVSDFVQKYNQALTAFLDSQRSMEQYMRNAMGMNAPSPMVADWAKLMWGPFNPALWASTRSEQPTPAEPPAAGSAPTPGNGSSPAGSEEQNLRQELDALRQQLSDLHEQLGKGKKRGRSQAE